MQQVNRTFVRILQVQGRFQTALNPNEHGAKR
jgi:hypothetical protein